MRICSLCVPRYGCGQPSGECSQGSWRPVPPGHLLVIRQGGVRDVVKPWQDAPQLPLGEGLESRRRRPRPQRAEVKRFDISHRTIYRYAQPVEHSTHLFRLQPIHDRMQTVRRSELTISVEGLARQDLTQPSDVIRQ